MNSNEIDRQVARSLTDEALADRLRTVASDVRAFDPPFRAALLGEAARRLDPDDVEFETCVECGSNLDAFGYCPDPGCRLVGKTQPS